jgi:hypothetical protein
MKYDKMLTPYKISIKQHLQESDEFAKWLRQNGNDVSRNFGSLMRDNLT